jgi:hypothetical protein
MPQGDDPDNPIYVYDEMAHSELKRQTHLLRSIEHMMSVFYWYFVISLILFCGLLSAVFILGYSSITTFIEMLPPP